MLSANGILMKDRSGSSIGLDSEFDAPSLKYRGGASRYIPSQHLSYFMKIRTGYRNFSLILVARIKWRNAALNRTMAKAQQMWSLDINSTFFLCYLTTGLSWSHFTPNTIGLEIYLGLQQRHDRHKCQWQKIAYINASKTSMQKFGAVKRLVFMQRNALWCMARYCHSNPVCLLRSCTLIR